VRNEFAAARVPLGVRNQWPRAAGEAREVEETERCDFHCMNFAAARVAIGSEEPMARERSVNSKTAYAKTIAI